MEFEGEHPLSGRYKGGADEFHAGVSFGEGHGCIPVRVRLNKHRVISVSNLIS